MSRSLSLFLALIISLLVQAQRGTIIGTVTALENGKAEPQPFANVVIKGTTTGASTDLDGKYFFKVEPGTYTVVTTMVGYPSVEKAVSVVADQTVTVDLQLDGAAMEMKAVEVVKEKRTDTEAAVLMDTRKSEQVVNGLGRQQIAKSQDRTASDVVKRIPGVTIIGDRFIMVRGLADRYNTVLLNDVAAPSMEADKRAFSFDLIPSAALDRILIYKSGAPELPGDFAGGTIKIGTMSVPEKNETRFTVSTSFRPGTTFQDFRQDKSSGTDAFGFDDGSRLMPSDFPTTLIGANHTTAQNAGRSLSNNWASSLGTAMPDGRIGLYIARRFGKKDGRNTYGNLTSIDYSNTRLRYTAKNYNYNAYDPELGRSDTIYNYNDEENIQSARVTLMHNWTAMLGKHGRIDFRNLLNQMGDNQTTFRTGRDLEGGNELRNYAFRYRQRTIYSGQLHGSHDIGEKSKLEWTLGYGKAISKEPDFRRISTRRDLGTGDANAPFTAYIPLSADPFNAGRSFSELHEDVYTARADYERTLKESDDHWAVKLRGGLYSEYKQRDFSMRWLSYTKGINFNNDLAGLPMETIFSAQNINGQTGFELDEGTNASDKYDANNTLMAGYLGGTAVYARRWTISGGARMEYNRQVLNSARYSGRTVSVDNTLVAVLPSANVSLAIGEKQQVRMAYSNTLNRPEFRELAPFSYYDFTYNNVLAGNDSLKTAYIHNVEARWELYPALNEIISFGVFYKRFENPIETYFVPGGGGGGTRNFTFGNAVGATSLGAEMEVRRSLKGWFENGLLSRLGVQFNATYISTSVDLGKKAVGQSGERPLMGQSPYVVNAGLYYTDTDHKLQCNVLYNVIGPRLFAVGTFGTPDIYEMPRNVVDVTLTKGLGERFELKLSAQDVLNQRTRLIQDSNEDGSLTGVDEEVMSFRRGGYFSAGLSYRF